MATVKAKRTTKPRKTTSDALAIIDRRFLSTPEAKAILAEEQANGEVGRLICAARTEAGLSQRALAKLVGTTASVICDLEDADYRGHSLGMLRRIAAALGKRVEVRFEDEKAVGRKRRSSTEAKA